MFPIHAPVPDLIYLLKQNAGAISALATVVLVGITAWYAHLTQRLARTAERQASLFTRAERDAQVETGQLLREEVRRIRGALPQDPKGYPWEVPDRGSVPEVHPWAATSIAKMARYNPEIVASFMQLAQSLDWLRGEAARARTTRAALRDSEARVYGDAALSQPSPAVGEVKLAPKQRCALEAELSAAEQVAGHVLETTHAMLNRTEAQLTSFLENVNARIHDRR